MGEQEALFKTDSVGHMPPVQSGEMFSARKKKKKNPQLFLFHPSWVVCPFPVAMTTAALLLLHLVLFPNGEQWMQKIRKWERQVGIKGIRIIYPGEENAKRWQL